MNEDQLEIHDTCPCGAQLIVRGHEIAVKYRHREWLDSHGVCRDRAVEVVSGPPGFQAHEFTWPPTNPDKSDG